MKYGTVKVSFKTPDSVEYAARDHAEYMANENVPDGGWKDEDRAEYIEEMIDEVKEKLAKWISYGECVTVSFDLDKMEMVP